MDSVTSPYSDPVPAARAAMAQQPEEETRSIGEILSDVTRNVSTLLRQEVDLAKAELRQSTSKAGPGLGMIAGAAVAGLLFLVFLSVSAWWGLGQFIGNEWSGLVVAVIWAIVAAVLYSAGKKQMDKVKGLPKTAETAAKIPDALKGHEERNQ